MKNVKRSKKSQVKSKRSSKKSLDFDTYEFSTKGHIKLSNYSNIRSVARKKA